MPTFIEGHFKAPSGARYAIVVARWNAVITERLLEGCLDGFVRHGVSAEAIDVIRVPGSFELPVVLKKVLESKRYVAAVALGCVIKGATAHFDYVAGEAAKGIGQLALQTGVPVVFGVLTCDTLEQALDRAGAKAGNKGYEAATVALELSDLLGKL